MSTYGSKGLAIFQVNNDGATKGTPNTSELGGWVKLYKAAGASGIDPRRRSVQYYYSGATVAIPYNFILDAKTRKILERNVPATNLTSRFDYYLNK